jgi:hypothetical protein
LDAIIAQGLEAGGHRGMFLSDDLTTQMGTFVDRLHAPLVRTECERLQGRSRCTAHEGIGSRALMQARWEDP